MIGSNKYLKQIGLQMILERDFHKEGGDPSSLHHVSIYRPDCVFSCFLRTASTEHLSWTSGFDLTELTGTMKISGVFLLLSLALFCFFPGEFFSLKFISTLY